MNWGRQSATVLMRSLDIHKQTVVVCLIEPGPGGPVKANRSSGTPTDDLLALADWLVAAGCTIVDMESTGVCWKPTWSLLEGGFELRLASARHVNVVAGRKTDVRDCEWLADLPRHGLLPTSSVPDRPQRERRGGDQVVGRGRVRAEDARRRSTARPTPPGPRCPCGASGRLAVLAGAPRSEGAGAGGSQARPVARSGPWRVRCRPACVGHLAVLRAVDC
jgi:hypothetical protein